VRRTREFDKTAISITVTRAGGKESAPVTLTGKELAELPRMVAGKQMGPKTKAQSDAADLFREVVRRGMGLEWPPARNACGRCFASPSIRARGYSSTIRGRSRRRCNGCAVSTVQRKERAA
jgi:hypothetical protein